MKKLLVLFFILAYAPHVYALPYYSATQTMVPFQDNAYDLGTSTARYRNLYISGTCTGCGGSSLDTSLLYTNAVVSWNGSQFIATGTPQLTVGNLVSTSTTATSTLTGAIQSGTTVRDNQLNVTATRLYPASVTVGGMVNFSNGTLNTGPALVINGNTSAGQTTGRLLVVTDPNTSSSQDTIIASSSATGITTLNLKGIPTGKGILKIEHTGGGTGYSNGSAVSLDTSVGDAQGLFIKSGTGTPLNVLDSSSASLYKLDALGNSTTTAVAYAATASSTSLYGAGLFACTGTSFIQWTGGKFSCAIPSAGSAASTTLLGDNNTFSGTDKFNNPITDGTLTGLIAGNSGLTYAVSTTSMNASITGLAGTATALANNGTNCNPNNFPLGVDASGNSENCTLASLLATSSPLAPASGLLYATGVNTFASVSTSSPLQTSITGNAATVTTNANLTGSVVSVGNTTTFGSTAVSNSVLANNTSGAAVPAFIATSTLMGTGTGGQVLGWLNGTPTWTASSSVAAGTGISVSASGAVTTITNTGVITVGNGTGTTCTGTNPASCSLASISAGVLGSSITGIPTSQSTSTLYGVGTGGQVLTWSNGVPSWVATTTYANGTGISTAFVAGQLTVTNTGVISVGNGTGVTCTGTNPASCSLASINAGVLGTNVAGIPASIATSTLYGATGVGGTVLGWANGVLTFIATSSSAGAVLPTGTQGQTLSYVGTTLTATSTLTISSTSKVGVSTSTPWGSLSVGSANASSILPLFVVATSSAAVATTTAFFVNGNGNVGVGTTSPFSSLSIEGTIAQLNLCNGAGNPCLELGFIAAGNQAGVFGTETNAGFFLRTNAVNRLAITNSGAIGFGDTTPDYQFESVGTSGLGYLGISSTATSPEGDVLTIGTTGKLGVGSSTPWGILSIGNYVTTAANTPLFTISSTTGGTATSTFMIVLPNGSVGIGATTSPFALLTVTASTSIQNIQPLFAVSSSTLNASSSIPVFELDEAGVKYTSGKAPSNSACPGFVASTTADNNTGTITMNSGTTCTFTFGTPWKKVPACMVTPGSALSTTLAVPTLTQLAVTFGSANTKFAYICQAHQ